MSGTIYSRSPIYKNSSCELSKIAKMCLHVQSRKSVYVSGEHCCMHTSSPGGCVLCTLMNSAVAVQHKELLSEDRMELEAQGRDKGKRKKK